MSSASDTCEPCWTDAEDPLFMLYTRYKINYKLISYKLLSKEPPAFMGISDEQLPITDCRPTVGQWSVDRLFEEQWKSSL